MSREPVVMVPQYVVTMYVPRAIAAEAPLAAVRAFVAHVAYTCNKNEVFPVSPWTTEVLQPAYLMVDGVKMLAFPDEPLASAVDGVMLRATCDAIPMQVRASSTPGFPFISEVPVEDGPTIYGGPWS